VVTSIGANTRNIHRGFGGGELPSDKNVGIGLPFVQIAIKPPQSKIAKVSNEQRVAQPIHQPTMNRIRRPRFKDQSSSDFYESGYEDEAAHSTQTKRKRLLVSERLGPGESSYYAHAKHIVLEANHTSSHPCEAIT